jgi:hypothetical protein
VPTLATDAEPSSVSFYFCLKLALLCFQVFRPQFSHRRDVLIDNHAQQLVISLCPDFQDFIY